MVDYLDHVFNFDKLRENLRRAQEDLAEVDFDTIVVRGMSGALFGPQLAMAMGKNLAVSRKRGKETSHSVYGLEYIGAISRYVVVDDFVASGSTVEAAIESVTSDTREHRFAPRVFVGVYEYRDGIWTPRAAMDGADDLYRWKKVISTGA